jgi:low temperature requirement protein LtrA
VRLRNHAEPADATTDEGRHRVTHTDPGVTTIELFFDLVFVFTITQLTHAVAREPTLTGVARAMLIFGNLWWMYGGFVWLTNTVPPTGARERLLLLVAMAGFLVAALGIPKGFAGGGVALGAGYLLVNVIHAWLLLGRMEGSLLRAMGKLGPVNIGTASLILAAGFTPTTITWVLWSAAFVLHWVTPYLTNPTVVDLRSRHFVERHGLIVLIALGESVIAVGAGIDDSGVSIERVIAAILGLAVAAGLWWLYFDREEESAVNAFKSSDGPRRSWLALHAYGYAFLPLLAGVIIFAAGLQRGIIDPTKPTESNTATLVAAGISLFAIALVGLRARLRLGRLRLRFALVPLALLTIIIGTKISALAQLGAIAALLLGTILAERRSLPG